MDEGARRRFSTMLFFSVSINDIIHVISGRGRAVATTISGCLVTRTYTHTEAHLGVICMIDGWDGRMGWGGRGFFAWWVVACFYFMVQERWMDERMELMMTG